MPFIQMRLILRCHTATSAVPRTARDFKFGFGILKFHRTTHPDFVANAACGRAFKILSQNFLKFRAEAFGSCAARRLMPLC